MAISDFVHAANIDFEDPRGKLWEGFIYAKIGNYHEAVRAYGDALAASDRYTPAFANRGLAYMMLGEYQRRSTISTKRSVLDPTRAEYYFKRGIGYAELGDHKRRLNRSPARSNSIKRTTAPTITWPIPCRPLGHSQLANEYRQKAESLKPPRSRPTPRRRARVGRGKSRTDRKQAASEDRRAFSGCPKFRQTIPA